MGAKYLDIFGKENVHIIWYSNFKEKTENELNKVISFLGLNTNFRVDFNKIHNSFSKPKWDLSRQKKNVLFYGEQGIGEQIIYSQFYETIKEQFENSTIAVNEKLIPFFKKIYTNTKIINYKKVFEYNEYDYHLPLGSMGLYFQKYINQKNLKRKIEYLSNSNIPIKTKKLRCGISWKSTNRIFGNKKSIKLENLKNILSN